MTSLSAPRTSTQLSPWARIVTRLLLSGLPKTRVAGLSGAPVAAALGAGLAGGGSTDTVDATGLAAATTGAGGLGGAVTTGTVVEGAVADGGDTGGKVIGGNANGAAADGAAAVEGGEIAAGGAAAAIPVGGCGAGLAG